MKSMRVARNTRLIIHRAIPALLPQLPSVRPPHSSAFVDGQVGDSGCRLRQVHRVQYSRRQKPGRLARNGDRQDSQLIVAG